MISPEEFEALPQSIQRKCFSPAERLRIGQQALESRRKKQQPMKGSWLAPPSASPSPLPSPRDGSQRPSTSSGVHDVPELDSTPVSCINLVTAKQKTITEDEARWFLNLPEKIRRLQFTREEQITLAIRCKTVLQYSSPDLAKDAFRRCCSEPKRQPRPFSPPSRKQSTSTTTSLSQAGSFLDIDAASVRTTDTSNAEMKIFQLYSRRSDANLRPQEHSAELHAPSQTPDGPQLPDTPRPVKKLRRRFSLTPIPLPPPTLAPLDPGLSPTEMLSPTTRAAMSARLSRPYIDLFASVPELPKVEEEVIAPLERRPYHDQDIRKQLRKSLVTAKSFDDVLAYGYTAEDAPPLPSAAGSENFAIQHPPSSSGGLDSSDDYDTASEGPGPRTPTPNSEQLLTNVKKPSIDSDVGIPLDQATEDGLQVTRRSSGRHKHRAMTIHMTLTRPDLHSPEDELYSYQRRQTSGVDVEREHPLALQDLTFSDDPSGAHGAFAPHADAGSKPWRKVLKTLRGH